MNKCNHKYAFSKSDAWWYLSRGKEICNLCKEVRDSLPCEHQWTRIPQLDTQHCWKCGAIKEEEC